MRINTNIPSLQAQRRLNETTQAFARALERLASGKRINRAGDDASGLAISEGLNAQIRGLNQGVRNINNAQGILNTADGALQTQIEIVQRMKELALQAANGTQGSQNRRLIQDELDQLLEEFDRIANSTEFNGRNLLDGSLSSFDLQIGPKKENITHLTLESSRSGDIFRENISSDSYAQSEIPDISYNARTELIDFDGDGNLDLFVNTQKKYLEYYKGDGHGNFTKVATTNVGALIGTGMTDFHLSDLNGDGDLDLVFAHSADNSVHIGFGDGSGTFSSFSTIYTSATDINSVQLADLNGDGRDDILVPDANSNEALIFTNNGSGSFSLSQSFSVDTTPWSTDIGDVNNDGILDFIVASRGNGNTSVFLGLGNGSFEQASDVVVGVANFDSKLGDLNGDGNLDMVSSQGTNLRVFLGDGRGNFQIEQSILGLAGISNAENVSVIDMNNDGKLDVLVNDGDSNDGRLSIYYGLGNGHLDTTPAVTLDIDSSSYVTRPSIGDINNDGFLDIIDASEGTGFDSEPINIFTQLIREASATSKFDLTTQTNAQNLLEILDNGLNNLLERRSLLGAQQNQLDYARNSNQLASESLESARSQILDTDIAQETAELVRTRILQQAATSVLAQANVNLQIILQLLP